MGPSLEDTIVATATAAGTAAIAIVRLSGSDARRIAQVLTPGARPRRPHELVRARVTDGAGRALDDAMVVEMHAPRSYTGEDVVELHLHGSPALVARVVEECVVAGARLAEPGEFTLRAFLCGRLDLVQAEAVQDLVGASTEVELGLATAQLAGGLSRAIGELLEQLEGVLASWRAALDFPEQVGEGGLGPAERDVVGRVRERIMTLVEQARTDLRQRARVVLCGAPNVGKSSLLNALVGERRVLVDAAPGTTRDPVEVELVLGRARLALWDTAGLRAQAEGLEREGIDLAWERLAKADVALWLVAADAPVWPLRPVGRRLVCVVSKADLAATDRRAELAAEAASRGLELRGFVSTVSDEGIADVRRWLAREPSPVAEGALVVVRERHVDALRRAGAALERVLVAEEALPLDLRAVELEDAAKSLARMLGRDVDLEVLDRIFAEFCLGK